MRTGARLSGLAMIAASLSGAAGAQEPSLESRLVQAFRTYCMASAADPKRVSAGVLREYFRNSGGGSPWITKGLDVVITKTPYSSVRVLFDEPPGAPARTCTADVFPPLIDKQRVVAMLEHDLGLGAGTSTVLPEITPKVGGSPRGPRPETDLTVWQTRMDNTEAEVEFRVPEGQIPKLRLSVRTKGK
jgi:hypothetical protein